MESNKRLGAGEKESKNDMEALKQHKFFEGINFETLHLQKVPMDLSNLVELRRASRSVNFVQNMTMNLPLTVNDFDTPTQSPVKKRGDREFEFPKSAEKLLKTTDSPPSVKKVSSFNSLEQFVVNKYVDQKELYNSREHQSFRNPKYSFKKSKSLSPKGDTKEMNQNATVIKEGNQNMIYE